MLLLLVTREVLHSRAGWRFQVGDLVYAWRGARNPYWPALICQDLNTGYTVIYFGDYER